MLGPHGPPVLDRLRERIGELAHRPTRLRPRATPAGSARRRYASATLSSTRSGGDAPAISPVRAPDSGAHSTSSTGGLAAPPASIGRAVGDFKRGGRPIHQPAGAPVPRTVNGVAPDSRVGVRSNRDAGSPTLARGGVQPRRVVAPPQTPQEMVIRPPPRLDDEVGRQTTRAPPPRSATTVFGELVVGGAVNDLLTSPARQRCDPS